MKDEPTELGGWKALLERMFDELRSGVSRADAYWAQQMAFGPVFIHAVILSVHKAAIAPEDLESLRRVLPLALSMLGALPDGCDGDPSGYFLLAHRQAQVLAWAGAAISPGWPHASAWRRRTRLTFPYLDDSNAPMS